METEKLLAAINEFLASKKKPLVSMTDKLYSSGLLDSLDMFELVLTLERKIRPFPEKVHNLNTIMASIDSPEQIAKVLSY